MATDNQFEYFKYLYEEEAARIKSLEENAKGNIGFTTLFSGFIVLSTDKIHPVDYASKWLFAFSMLVMVLAFLLSLFATRVLGYEISNSPEIVLKELLEDETPSDEAFLDARIIDFAVAAETNAKINDLKADLLNWARYSLLAGIAS